MAGFSAIGGCRRWGSKGPRGPPSAPVVSGGRLCPLAGAAAVSAALWAVERQEIRRLAHAPAAAIRTPSGLQFFVEMAGFTLFLLLLGKLGEHAMAATTLAFNLNVLAFMPMIGLSIALSTLVGQELGRDRPDLASRATWVSLLMAAAYMGTMALAYVFLPKVLMLGMPSARRRRVRRNRVDNRRLAPIRGRLLPVRRHERCVCRHAKRGGRHAVHPADIPAAWALPTAGGMAGNPMRFGSVLVLGRHGGVGFQHGSDLRARFLTVAGGRCESSSQNGPLKEGIRDWRLGIAVSMEITARFRAHQVQR